MDRSVLVTYASKYGATGEIAERIGSVLRKSGLQVDVFPVSRVPDLSPYSAVILGSALYVGKWQKEAETFLKAHERTLVLLPVWLFSSGPTGKGDPVELVEGQKLPAALQPVVDRIKPREITVFHGNINPDKLNFLEKWAIKSVVKKPFGDFRDWDQIVAWSAKIASTLKETVVS